MLSGSAMARVAILVVTAGLLAGLIQYFWPKAQEPAPQPPGLTRPRESQAAPPRETVRTVPTPRAPAAPAEPILSEAPPQPKPPQPKPPLSEAPSVPAPPAPAQPAPPPSAVPPPTPAPDPVEIAQDEAGPRAVALVDLNTGTLAELNGLRGGGNIGRAIIQRRPYTAVDQLLSKRVLSRATYERIKDQVTVQ